jgi:hypothetical protein
VIDTVGGTFAGGVTVTVVPELPPAYEAERETGVSLPTAAVVIVKSADVAPAATVTL